MKRYRTPGQTLIEMALALPILLTLVIGLFTVGQILLIHYAVNQAVRAAVHQAALTGGDRAATELAARQALHGSLGIDVAASEVVISCPRRPCRRYDPITVEVRYRASLWATTALLPFSEDLVVRASATRAAERDQQ
ncbi:MAG TPA: pilus assembly protein [Chloroflexus aurantiacus]|uniref:TadE family protein n=1 Tax=Chloroflexus aurantiacus (strain ATCC 29366 / DSM 635 / J-10-fl) TaxID=324602 RepID=A9WH48_CHLAA|nr:TadE family protein [Chloroflexus aurantiacus]ABY34143.1 TadE family protein [Chloroflexus aurantiacus J-10-fl]RMG51507.1 MAG: pilus assembly protein [Chloroflexota bacterium]GIV93588.1 MAG: pilus assembly protein TadE [Chloroflexus sp.]HBW67138.1 pilus assembly protein [Chloroflexus aurantiacus]